MRSRLFLFIVEITFHVTGMAQGQYEVLKDNDGGKILKGIISREILSSDTSFKWYANNLKSYSGSYAASFGKHRDSIQLLIFRGTWCEDSQLIIPKLFRFFDAAGFSNDRITLIGVDRNKKSISHITDALNVINLPTLIVMKEGKELGRVVEYGQYGMVEKELAEIAGKK